KHLPADSPRHGELPQRLNQGRAALAVMETHLKGRRYFVAEGYSIADIALYAYTHVAHEAQLDLEPYPNVRSWLARVAGQPGHVPITSRPAPTRTA
ncbi:MAG: glutathione S-transferase C-terminal domain-containing protein, partial [Gammaproteobacteria bacterium]|nr:glutathione S-transferase C-terminal domain-containing protein [Gammaproteobacteria bacterium]